MLVHGGCGQRGGGAYLDGSVDGDGRAFPERATGQTRTTGRACGPEPFGAKGGGAIPGSQSSREHQIIQTGDHSASRRIIKSTAPVCGGTEAVGALQCIDGEADTQRFKLKNPRQGKMS